MASQEHLQQLMDGDSSDSSSDSSSSSNMEADEASAKSDSVPTSATPRIKLPTSVHPKKRMKISLKSSPSSVQSEAAAEEEEEEEEEEEDDEEPRAKRTLPMASTFPKVQARSRSLSPTSQRQRLNKRALPIKKKNDSPPKQNAVAGEVKATVVETDEEGEDDAVATAIDDELASTGRATPVGAEKTQQKKKPHAPNYRSVRLPPFSSPGLLVPISHSITLITGKGKPEYDPSNPASSGLTNMGSVFDQYLIKTGYTEESRTKIPHIGSSIKRQVGDMFDTNINFATEFPKLVPEGLIPSESKNDMEEDDESRFALAKRFISAVEVKQSAPGPAKTKTQDDSKPENGTSSEAPRKLQKLKSWKDMVPLSLTCPYPQSYVQKQIEYAEKVKKRELAILAYKEEVEALERENPELSDDEETMKPTTVVPPIPSPPSPPHLSELTGFDKNEFTDTTHPVYLPKLNELVDHLDKDFFHITEGRYFGLSSNKIADPIFVGPVAPGVPNLTASNALATAQAGGLNVGGFPNQSTLSNANASKGSSGGAGTGKKGSNESQAVSVSPTIAKKKKKKPAISLPLRPIAVISKPTVS